MVKPNISLIKECLNREISYDFKKNDLEEEDSIVRFLKYKKPSSKLPDYDRSESTMSVLAQYVKEVMHADNASFEERRIYINGSLIGETDTINSFWSTYRALLEFAFNPKQKSKGYDKELLYEFVLMFGGISSRKKVTPKLNEKKYAEYGITGDELENVKEYFRGYEGKYEFKLDNYIKYCNGNNKIPDKDLEEERIEWLISHREDLKRIIISIGCIELYEALKTFAGLTHSIGNFGIVPLGFNVGRTSVTNDYFDLSLVILMGMCQNKGWYDSTVNWFAENYREACAYECYFEQRDVKHLFRGHSFEKIFPSTVQEFLEYFNIVNSLIIGRGYKIISVLKKSEEKGGLKNVEYKKGEKTEH